MIQIYDKLWEEARWRRKLHGIQKMIYDFGWADYLGDIDLVLRSDIYGRFVYCHRNIEDELIAWIGSKKIQPPLAVKYQEIRAVDQRKRCIVGHGGEAKGGHRGSIGYRPEEVVW